MRHMISLIISILKNVRTIFVGFWQFLLRTLRVLDVTLQISQVDETFPAGTIGGNWVIYLYKNNSQTHYYEGVEPFTTFEDVTPGNYTVYGVRLDINGEQLGSIQESEIQLNPNIFKTTGKLTVRIH